MRITTLKEQGAQLPLGCFHEGDLQRDLRHRPYRAWIDQSLGLWRQDLGDKFTGTEKLTREVSYLSGLLLTQYGPAPIQLIDQPDKGVQGASPDGLLALHQGHMGDVLYAYVWLRRQVLGPEYQFAARCPDCKWEGKPIFDLDSLEVHAADSLEDLERWVELCEPFPLRGGGECHSVLLRPLSWMAMGDPGMSLSLGAGTYGVYVAQRSVVAINGSREPYTVTPAELLQGLGKRDLVRLERATDNWKGINVRFQVNCPGTHNGKPCESRLVSVLDWSVENFFADSLPTPEI